MQIDTKKKLAGILVPVFALRHDEDFGIGDTRAMAEAVDFCAANNIGVLQILPVNETGGDNSPYNAISSVALDPIYAELAPKVVPGLTTQMIESTASSALLETLRKGSVQYSKVRALKIDILRKAFNAFWASEAASAGEQSKSFTLFKDENERWLQPYTLFRTLMQEHAGSSVWTQWPENQQDYETAKSDAAKTETLAQQRQFWAYVQWVLYSQWRTLKKYAGDHSVQIMGDLPFGVSRYSADVWSERKVFDLDWSCGAPPETYFQGDKFVRVWGQNWGMPIYDWEENRKENFSWWRQRIKHLNELFHYIRIDHVLGFFRVYAFPWIPERNGEFIDLTKEEAKVLTGGPLPHFVPRSDEEPEDAVANAKDGTEYMRVLLDTAGSTGIVAEDLGTVPDYVRPLLHDLGMAGFAIPIFERVEEDRSFKPKETLHELSLATYGTHDHQPIKVFYEDLVKWWHSADGHEGWREVQRLMNFLGEDEEHPPESFTSALHKSMLKSLLETPCWLAVLMITDLLGTSQRFNEPGLSGDSNWSQRLDRPLKNYLSDEAFNAKITYFRDLIKETNRFPLVSVRS